MGVGCTKDAKTAGCSPDEDGFSYSTRIRSPLNESICEQATDGEVRDGGHQPREAGVEKGVHQV